MSNFFTADPHFGHANIIRYSNRPWLDPATDLMVNPEDPKGPLIWVSDQVARKRCDEMDAAIISNWNSVVGPEDTVYLIGDFCFGKYTGTFRHYFDLLTGKIIFIKGNHDKLAWANRQCFFAYHDSYLETKVQGQTMTICHYAMRVWNKSHHGAWNLYGHSHGSLPDDPNALAIDVGMDCHDFKPISFEQVAAIMAKKKFKPIDHHGE